MFSKFTSFSARSGLLAIGLLAASLGAYAQQSLQDATTTGTVVTVDTSGLGTSIGGSVLVDNNPSNTQLLNNNGTATIDLGSAQVIKGYRLTDDPSNTAFNPTGWSLQGSNTAGSGYVTLDTRSGNTWEMLGSRKFFAANNNTAYRYYRIVNTGGAQIHIAEIELFQNFSIQGSVFRDYNLNNIKDAGEPAVVGTKVWLKQLTVTTPLVTVFTDVNGAYQFTGSQIDGQERFSVVVQPQGNLQPRTEPVPFDWPRTWPDASYVFANESPLQSGTSPYQRNGVVNFGFLPPSVSYTTDTIATSPNLITNEQGGSFGTSDSTGNAFTVQHINARFFDRQVAHPESFFNVTDYTVGSNYTFSNNPGGTSGVLYIDARYAVTDMLGSVQNETGNMGDGKLSVRGTLNDYNWGWRYTTGATTGAWNDRFMAVNGIASSTAIGPSSNIFADTVNLLGGNNYAFGLYAKGANKWFQGSFFAVATKLRFTVINLANGDTATIGYLTIQPTTGDATDSINLGWQKIVSNFKASVNGSYGVYYQTYANGSAGNDAYLDNFFLRKSSYLISGKVYDDANGLNNGAVDGTPINTLNATPLYAYLLDPVTNQVVDSSIVAADGSYSLAAPDFKSYKVVITTQMLTSGDMYNSAGALPSGWTNVGSNTGSNNTTGNNVNSLSTSVLVSPVDPASDITGVNFGLDQLPESYNRTMNVTGPPVIGAPISLGSVPMQGSDPEYNGGTQANWNNNSIVITSLPTNGFVLTYNGIPVNAGDTIKNYNPALLTITATGSTPIGTAQTSFQYATLDSASKADPTPATYSVLFSIPLPIVLQSFTAAASPDCSVHLDWNTASEENVKNIGIERSDEGDLFSTIATVVPKGSGYYNYTDQHLTADHYAYRLKFNDNDGTFTYSPVNAVSLHCKPSVKVYPTSTSGTVYIEGANTGAVIKITDVAGRVVKSTAVTRTRMPLSLEGQPSAVYFITVYDGKIPVQQVRIVKQ